MGKGIFRNDNHAVLLNKMHISQYMDSKDGFIINYLNGLQGSLISRNELINEINKAQRMLSYLEVCLKNENTKA